MKFLLTIIIASATFYAYGQAPQTPQKIGHADWDYIFSQLPEYKRIETELKTFETQLQNQLKVKSQELETKYKVYKAMSADTPDAIKKDKESELAYLQETFKNSSKMLRSQCKKNRPI